MFLPAGHGPEFEGSPQGGFVSMPVSIIMDHLPCSVFRIAQYVLSCTSNSTSISKIRRTMHRLT